MHTVSTRVLVLVFCAVTLGAPYAAWGEGRGDLRRMRGAPSSEQEGAAVTNPDDARERAVRNARERAARPAPETTGSRTPAAVADDIDPAQTSQDPTFGYSKDNPVKLGSPTMRAGGSYAYLDQLRDKHKKPFKWRRIGNVGEGNDQHIVDLYSLIDSEGKEHRIYVDLYHPENPALECKAPQGMFIAQ